MSIHKPHLVPVTLSDAGDEVIDVAEGGTDGRGGLARSEPGVDLQLLLTGFLVGDELKIEVEMLEVASESSSRSLHFDHFRVHLDLHPIGNFHGFG